MHEGTLAIWGKKKGLTSTDCRGKNTLQAATTVFQGRAFPAGFLGGLISCNCDGSHVVGQAHQGGTQPAVFVLPILLQ